jgi:general secretion pathway protein J
MKARGRGGFTLLEMMLAVTILALVSASVYSTWSAGQRAWKRGMDVSALFQRERVVMDALAELGEALVFFGGRPDIYAVTGTHDEALGDSVSFVTGSDAVLPPGEWAIAGLRRVTLSLQRDQTGRTYLAIVNTPALVGPDDQPQGAPHVLSAEVTGFTVRYRDAGDETWKDSWEEAAVPPAAMSFTVTFGDGTGRTPPVTITRAVELPTFEYAIANVTETPQAQPSASGTGGGDVKVTIPGGGQ